MTGVHAFRRCHAGLFVTLWIVALQPPLSLGFSRQDYWGGLPFPPPGDLPKSGMEPVSLASPALADGFFTTSASWEVPGSMLATCYTYILSSQAEALHCKGILGCSYHRLF